MFCHAKFSHDRGYHAGSPPHPVEVRAPPHVLVRGAASRSNSWLTLLLTISSGCSHKTKTNKRDKKKKKIKGLPLTSFRASVAGTGEVCKRTGDKRLGRDKRGMTDELLPDRSGTALEVNPGGVYFGPGLGSRAAEPCGGQGVRQRKTGETLTD